MAQAWYSLDFVVRDAGSGAPIGNAIVHIDVDFGNGTSRFTDGGGFANFGVVEGHTINWRVEVVRGYQAASGQVWVGGHHTVDVWLYGDGPPPAPHGVGQPVEYASGDGRVIITPFENDGDANTIEMHMRYIAPTGRFQHASCLRLWSDHPDWTQEIGCAFGLGTGIWEDDYDYYAPRGSGTIASAWIDYQHGLPVQPPPPFDDPFRRTWSGIPCYDLQVIGYHWHLIHERAVRGASRDALVSTIGCVGASIGWAACVSGTWGISFLAHSAFEYWDYKNACDW